MEAAYAVRIGAEIVDLLLELGRIGPIVIALAEGDEFTVGLAQGHEEVARDICRGATGQDFGPVAQGNPYPAGLTPGVFQADFAGTISRAIFPDQDFEGEIRLLSQCALDRLLDEGGVLIGNHANSYGRGHKVQIGWRQQMGNRACRRVSARGKENYAPAAELSGRRLIQSRVARSKAVATVSCTSVLTKSERGRHKTDRAAFSETGQAPPRMYGIWLREGKKYLRG